MSRSNLLAAIWRRDLTAVEALVAKGARLDRIRWREFLFAHASTPLQAALSARSLPIVEYLLDRGADPNGGNPRQGAPLSIACIKGEIPIMELLVARGARIDGMRDSPIASPIGVAATRRDLRAVEWLLEHGADPSTAFAANVPIDRSSLPVLKRLVEAGAKAPAWIHDAVRTGKW